MELVSSRQSTEEVSQCDSVGAGQQRADAFVVVRLHSNKDKDDIHSRGYITFKTPDALVAFHRGYDGWQFRDKTGKRFAAAMEGSDADRHTYYRHREPGRRRVCTLPEESPHRCQAGSASGHSR